MKRTGLKGAKYTIKVTNIPFSAVPKSTKISSFHWSNGDRESRWYHHFHHVLSNFDHCMKHILATNFFHISLPLL